jgi:hypothetical protein
MPYMKRLSTAMSNLCALFIGSIGLMGWILNIVNIAHSSTIYSPMFVLRCIGIFVAPVGSILGFIPWPFSWPWS